MGFAFSLQSLTVKTASCSCFRGPELQVKRFPGQPCKHFWLLSSGDIVASLQDYSPQWKQTHRGYGRTA